MKASIHLFYGIIIGVLICACTGSIKSDKAEFEVEQIEYIGETFGDRNKNLSKLKKEGWTILDIEIQMQDRDTYFYAHVGK